MARQVVPAPRFDAGSDPTTAGRAVGRGLATFLRLPRHHPATPEAAETALLASHRRLVRRWLTLSPLSLGTPRPPRKAKLAFPFTRLFPFSCLPPAGRGKLYWDFWGCRTRQGKRNRKRLSLTETCRLTTGGSRSYILYCPRSSSERFSSQRRSSSLLVLSLKTPLTFDDFSTSSST